MSDSKDASLSKKNSIKTVLPLFFLPYDSIVNIYNRNKTFMNLFKENYLKLEKEYSQYYNLDTRKKLITINPILENSLPTYIEKSSNISLESLCYSLAYSKIINKILRLNKIFLFKYTIDEPSKFNYSHFISLIMFMDYPKEIIINIKNVSLLTEIQFSSIVKEILKKKNVTSLTVYFEKNYFMSSSNAKRFLNVVKENNPNNKTFLKFGNIAYNVYNKEIGIENLCYNFEDFNTDMVIIEAEKEMLNIKNIEISLSFTENKIKELDDCLNYLNNSLSKNKDIINKELKLKLQIFSMPKDFDYIKIAKLISNIHPNNLWFIPFKDIDVKFAKEFLTIINSSLELITFNIINFVGFGDSLLKEFILKQKNMVDLRICGKLTEDEMETLLNTYYDLLQDNISTEYKIKKISINGPINMNTKWKELICKFLKLKQIEAFHIDCFFNEREFMKEIAEAFIENTTLKSFAVRNTCRPPKDYFVDILKESLYARKIPKKEVFTKIRLYKLL